MKAFDGVRPETHDVSAERYGIVAGLRAQDGLQRGPVSVYVREDQEFHGGIALGTEFLPAQNARTPGHAQQSRSCMSLADTTGPADRANPDVSGGAGRGEVDDCRALCVGRAMIGMMISQKTPYAGKNPLHRGHHLLRAAVLANPIAILITGIIGLAGVLSREPAEWLALGTPVPWPAAPRRFLVRCWRKEPSSPLGGGCFEWDN